jgi:uncharacterized protein
LDGFKRLDKFTKVIEKRLEPEADLKETVAHENRISKSLGGRSVFDDRPSKKPQKAQMDLFK